MAERMDVSGHCGLRASEYEIVWGEEKEVHLNHQSPAHCHCILSRCRRFPGQSPMVVRGEEPLCVWDEDYV